MSIGKTANADHPLHPLHRSSSASITSGSYAGYERRLPDDEVDRVTRSTPPRDPSRTCRGRRTKWCTDSACSSEQADHAYHVMAAEANDATRLEVPAKTHHLCHPHPRRWKNVSEHLERDGVEEYDDAGSTCSSASSEHSTMNSARTSSASQAKRSANKNHRSRRCELHPRKSASANKAIEMHADAVESRSNCDSLADGSVFNDISAATGNNPMTAVVCTCKTRRDSSSKQHKSHGKDLIKLKRPEPEGSLLVSVESGSLKRGQGSGVIGEGGNGKWGRGVMMASAGRLNLMVDEFERLIYSDDPMFSDLETDPEIDEQIREESDKLHRKADTAAAAAVGISRATTASAGAASPTGSDCASDAVLFSVAQSLNSCAILKIAIIGNELKNVKDTSMRRAECDVTSLTKRLQNVERNFEQSEKLLEVASRELTTVIESSGYNREELLNQMLASNSAARAAAPAEEKTRSNAASAAAGRGERLEKYFASRLQNYRQKKLIFNEVDLEMAEELLDTTEQRVQELEDELVAMNQFRPRNMSEQEYKDKVQQLTAELTTAEQRSTDIEGHILRLKMNLHRMHDEVTAEKKKYKPISNKLRTSFAELYSSL